MAFENTGVVPVMDIGGNQNMLGSLLGLLGGGGGFGGLGGGMGVILLVLFVILGGGNFFNRNNNNNDYATMAALANGAMTRSEVTSGFNAQDVNNALRGIQNGLCDGFYAQNTNVLNGFNNVGRDILDSRYQLATAIAENRFAAQNCCCETNRNIDAVRYEAAQNTCAITNNATENTQKILDKLCLMESNAKDQRIAQLQFDLQAAQLQIGNIRQTENIVNTVRPPVVPAYVVSSPYESIRHNYGYGGCGCGCGVTA